MDKKSLGRAARGQFLRAFSHRRDSQVGQWKREHRAPKVYFPLSFAASQAVSRIRAMCSSSPVRGRFRPISVASLPRVQPLRTFAASSSSEKGLPSRWTPGSSRPLAYDGVAAVACHVEHLEAPAGAGSPRRRARARCSRPASPHRSAEDRESGALSSTSSAALPLDASTTPITELAQRFHREGPHAVIVLDQENALAAAGTVELGPVALGERGMTSPPAAGGTS